MVFKSIGVPVLWTKVGPVLEGLMGKSCQLCSNALRLTEHKIFVSLPNINTTTICVMPPLPVPGRYDIADGDIYYNNSVRIEQLVSSYIDKQHKRNKGNVAQVKKPPFVTLYIDNP